MGWTTSSREGSHSGASIARRGWWRFVARTLKKVSAVVDEALAVPLAKEVANLLLYCIAGVDGGV